MDNISPQLIEIASWRIVSELLRCFPKKFTVLQTHPGGGQYDCLSLYLKKPDHYSVCDFNRNGSFHVFEPLDPRTTYRESWDIWERMMTCRTPEDVLEQVISDIGLIKPKKLPASTPEVLTYRFIAAFLAPAAFGRDQWRCENGVFDSSGISGSGTQGAWFRKFTGIPETVVTAPFEGLDHPAYGYWFITRNHKPQLALRTDGTVWRLDGKAFKIPVLYKAAGRQMGAVVGRIGGYYG